MCKPIFVAAIEEVVMHGLDWNASRQLFSKSGGPPEKGRPRRQFQGVSLMSFIVDRLGNSWLTRKDLDYHILRASMVVIFLFFGYQKWFEYEAKILIPYISNGPLIFWLYPVFGIRGASWFLRNPPVSWLLEQACRHSGRDRVDRHLCWHGHHHTLHA